MKLIYKVGEQIDKTFGNFLFRHEVKQLCIYYGSCVF